MLCIVLSVHVQEDVSNAYIVQLFDAIKSPRCYGIVAVKKTAAKSLT